MSRLPSPGMACPDVLRAGATDGQRRGVVRGGLVAGALAVVGALSLAAADAQATTFPGTNGRIAASGVLNTHPLNTGSRLELFTALPGGTNLDVCQLTDNEDSDYNPRYSKDGKKVAFVRNGNIWTMQLDAQGRAPSPGSTDPSNPCSDPPPSQETPPLYPAPNQPGDQKPLTVSGQDTFVGGWCTKPNGEEWVVFQRNTVALSFEVYKVQVDSTTGLAVPGTEMPLTRNAANDSQPSVRHDCSKIAFHSNRALPSPQPNGSHPSNIWAMDFDGANPAPVTQGVTKIDPITLDPTNLGSEESAPSWSPDGTRIAFQTDRHTATPRNLEIYRIDANGSTSTSSLVRLSHNAHSGSGGSLDLTGFDLNPQYSPDGTRVCFHSGRAAEFRTTGAPGTAIEGQWEIYHLDAVNGEGSTQAGTVRVTHRAGNDERCGWQKQP